MHYLDEPGTRAGVAEQVFQAVLAGELQVLIHATFPLERAAEAQDLLASGRTVGKLLLIP